MSKRVNQETNPNPGMMKIMSSVAEAAGISIHDLMSERRHAGITLARTAVYKLATSYGHPKEDITYFLDRSRRVAYNYESNIEGHLRRDKDFKSLIEKAKEILNRYPHREIWHPSKAPKEPETNNTQKDPDAEPEFKDTLLKLGWFFTAEENRKAWLACKAAAKFFETYGKPPRVHLKSETPTTQRSDLPEEMTTAEAMEYLGVGNKILFRGVQLGYLKRSRKEGSRTFWFKTDELDAFRNYLTKNQIFNTEQLKNSQQ